VQLPARYGARRGRCDSAELLVLPARAAAPPARVGQDFSFVCMHIHIRTHAHTHTHTHTHARTHARTHTHTHNASLRRALALCVFSSLVNLLDKTCEEGLQFSLIV
jgi:hypothetical protein